LGIEQFNQNRWDSDDTATALAEVRVGTYNVLNGTLEDSMAALKENQTESERIAHFIGLNKSECMSSLILARRVTSGFPVGTAKALARHIDPSGLLFVHSVIIPNTTLHNAKKTKRNLSKDHSEVIFLLGKVVAESYRIFRNPEKVSSFVMKPHPMLDGESPYSLAKSSVAGAEVVMNLLARADAGTAV
jgi:putative toxin-antitoxin system antitoxin component (TIGR02293 family)